jgi:hypothetical protein
MRDFIDAALLLHELREHAGTAEPEAAAEGESMLEWVTWVTSSTAAERQEHVDRLKAEARQLTEGWRIFREPTRRQLVFDADGVAFNVPGYHAHDLLGHLPVIDDSP